MMRFYFLFFLLPLLSYAQIDKQPGAAEIKQKLKKLNFLGSVLYVAAHPDDENTRIITYLANDRLAATAYLSLTRGDGGQNLIGPEIRDQLGLIRTQELLAARRIDGGEQFFTRANDFGYSKSADETFKLWGKEEVMHDVLKVYRMYQPDVIITRFPPDERAGHGHHTASALLAQEAFDLAAKKDVFPEQVEQFGTWQPKRLYTNTGRWWNTTINENTPGVLTLNVGGYDPLLGTSYTEIAAISRSQHKSQGFGSSGTRGDQLEFLEYVKGEKAVKDIFEGVNTTWTKVKGGDKIKQLVERAINSFNEDMPEASVPDLLAIRRELLSREEGVWKKRKLAEVETLIKDCLGLFLQVTADQYWVAPGQPVIVSFELVNRSKQDLKLRGIHSKAIALDTTLSLPLTYNKTVTFGTSKSIASKEYSNPYWLKEPHGIGLFKVTDHFLIGQPENNPAINVLFSLDINGDSLSIDVPLVYKWNDRVKGELIRPFEIVPPVFINLEEDVLIFGDNASKSVRALLKSSSQKTLKGKLSMQLPSGWRSDPPSIEFELSRAGEEQEKAFTVIPPEKEMAGEIKVVAEIDNKPYSKSIKLIAYDYIPIQTLLPEAITKVVRINLKGDKGQIGYIKGAGDEVPSALHNMGYNVWEMKNDEVTPINLQRLDAVVLGIRALNTNERIKFLMPILLDYVNGGGTLVVQYNTNLETPIENFSPYPLSISRDRVTDENSAVRILKPEHPVVNYPNKITSNDFEGWVQERGLYFPDKWDQNFEAILSMNDVGESEKLGSLLVAKYGAGYYVYTGLSFFRELPEGVSGAYKLFANIISLGKSQKQKEKKLNTKKG